MRCGAELWVQMRTHLVLGISGEKVQAAHCEPEFAAVCHLADALANVHQLISCHLQPILQLHVEHIACCISQPQSRTLVALRMMLALT